MEHAAAIEPPRPAEGEAVAVFLSFSKVDRAAALRVEEMIEGLGLRCWSYVSDQEAGSYAAHIANAIDACRIVVLLLTPASNTSAAVEREIGLAGERKRLIMPLCEDPTFELSPGLAYWIRTLQWSASIEELERLLRKEAPPPPAPPAPLVQPADGTAAEATTTAGGATSTKPNGWRWWGYLMVGMALLGFLVVMSQVFCAPLKAHAQQDPGVASLLTDAELEVFTDGPWVATGGTP